MEKSGKIKVLGLNFGRANGECRKYVDLALKEAQEEDRTQAAQYLYYLALMNYRPLKPEELEKFVSASAMFVQNFLKR